MDGVLTWSRLARVAAPRERVWAGRVKRWSERGGAGELGLLPHPHTARPAHDGTPGCVSLPSRATPTQPTLRTGANGAAAAPLVLAATRRRSTWRAHGAGTPADSLVCPSTALAARSTRTRASSDRRVRRRRPPSSNTRPRSSCATLALRGSGARAIDCADSARPPAELRRRREEAQVEIRKQKRDETIAKRRNLNAASSGADSDDESGVDSSVSRSGRPFCPIPPADLLSCSSWSSSPR